MLPRTWSRAGRARSVRVGRPIYRWSRAAIMGGIAALATTSLLSVRVEAMLLNERFSTFSAVAPTSNGNFLAVGQLLPSTNAAATVLAASVLVGPDGAFAQELSITPPKSPNGWTIKQMFPQTIVRIPDSTDFLLAGHVTLARSGASANPTPPKPSAPVAPSAGNAPKPPPLPKTAWAARLDARGQTKWSSIWWTAKAGTETMTFARSVKPAEFLIGGDVRAEGKVQGLLLWINPATGALVHRRLYGDQPRQGLRDAWVHPSGDITLMGWIGPAARGDIWVLGIGPDGAVKPGQGKFGGPGDDFLFSLARGPGGKLLSAGGFRSPKGTQQAEMVLIDPIAGAKSARRYLTFPPMTSLSRLNFAVPGHVPGLMLIGGQAGGNPPSEVQVIVAGPYGQCGAIRQMSFDRFMNLTAHAAAQDASAGLIIVGSADREPGGKRAFAERIPSVGKETPADLGLVSESTDLRFGKVGKKQSQRFTFELAEPAVVHVVLHSLWGDADLIVRGEGGRVVALSLDKDALPDLASFAFKEGGRYSIDVVTGAAESFYSLAVYVDDERTPEDFGNPVPFAEQRPENGAFADLVKFGAAPSATPDLGVGAEMTRAVRRFQAMLCHRPTGTLDDAERVRLGVLAGSPAAEEGESRQPAGEPAPGDEPSDEEAIDGAAEQ